MRTLTLFRAYEKALGRMESYQAMRARTSFGDGLQGIAVQNDYAARKWQRADRQATKLKTRIVMRLRNIPDA